MRRQRVLIIVENLPVPFDRRVWNEALALKEAGYEVTVICPTGKGATKLHETLEGIRIYRHSLPIEGSGPLGFAVEYSWALACEMALALWVWARHGIDAVHICNPPELLFLVGGFFKLVLRKKLLFDHHDLSPELYEAKFNRKDRMHRLLLTLERLTFRSCDIAIATNESFRQIAISRGGMRPDQTFVVRSGPDLNRIRSVQPNDAHKCGRKHLVGYLGVIAKQDGIDLLLHSISVIVHERRRRDIHFGIVGGGPELESMRCLAEELKISDYVTFTGRAPDALLLELLSTADICVNPDRVNEANDKSTMNKVLEYMALKKPIVQFEMTEGRNSAGGSSLYAAPNDPTSLADCILMLADNPELRETMGETGYRRIREQLSWEHEKPKLLAAYDALLKSHAASRAKSLALTKISGPAKAE